MYACELSAGTKVLGCSGSPAFLAQPFSASQSSRTRLLDSVSVRFCTQFASNS
jgi:hypothetical protein